MFLIELVKLARKGKLGHGQLREASQFLCDMTDENDDHVFYDSRDAPPDKSKSIKFESMYKKVRDVVADWRRTIAPMLRPELLESVVTQADKAKDSPASLKAVASIIEPELDNRRVDVNVTGEVRHSARLTALLQALDAADVQKISSTPGGGADALPEASGDQGHEIPVRGGVGTPGRGTLQALPLPGDQSVHGERDRKEIQGSTVPVATGVLEDNGGDDRRDDLEDSEE